MRKKGNTVLAGLIICLLLVFLAAAGKLFGAYLKYQKGDVSYEKLQEYVQEPEEEESPESEKEKEEPKNRYLEIDFAGLKAVNPDVIAWIQIPALDISYPVVQGKDNASVMDNAMARMMLETINNMMLELYASMAQAELEKKEKRQREGIEAKKLRGEWDDYGRPSVMKQETFDEKLWI